ncbi:MAG: LamG domain-containing protein [Candidatus Latescibacteria bacterium]|nr:LamG domain-containing protein [Candidatus Latescibacterota bacterium]
MIRCLVILILTMLLPFPGRAHSQSLSDHRSNLVLEMLFDGDARDTSGKGLHGVVSQTNLTADRFGKLDHAYRFDGVNSAIKIDPPPLLPTSGFTLSVWVNYGESGIYPYWSNGIIIQDLDTGARPQRALHLSTRGRVPILHLVGRGKDIRCTQEIIPGQWYHLAVSYDGVAYRFFKDGILQGRSDAPFVPGTDIPIYIGRRNTNHANFFFEGEIDDLRMYNRFLDASAIAELTRENGWRPPAIAATSQGRSALSMEEALVANWPLEDGGMKDDSGHEIHGQMIGKDPVSGVRGSAVHFDKAWGYARNANLALTHDLSLSFWIKGFDDAMSDWDWPLLWYGDLFRMYYRVSLKNGTIAFRVNGISKEREIVSRTTLVADEWTHVVVTMNTGDEGPLIQRIFLNGTLSEERRSQERYHSIVPSEMWFCLGANGPGWGPPGGVDMDEVSMYNKALNLEEVVELYTKYRSK